MPRHVSLETAGSSLFCLALALAGPLIALDPRQLPSWSILLALTATIACIARERRLPVPATVRPLVPLLVFIGYAILTLAWSPAKPLWFIASNLLYLTVVGSVSWRVMSGLPEKERAFVTRLLIVSLVLGGFIFGIEVACDFPVLHFVSAHEAAGRIYDTNVPKRSATIFALMVWPLLLCLYERRKSAPLLILVLVFAAVIGWLSTSRSVSLALMLGAITLALGFWRTDHVRRIVRAAFVVLLLGAPLGAAATHLLPESVTVRLFPSAQERLVIWQFAAREIMVHPVLGHGLDSSHSLENDAPPSLFKPNDRVMREHPHDTYLQIWLELGGIGALLLLAAGVRFLGLIDRLPLPAQPFAWAGIATALSLHGMTYGVWQAWWIAGQILAAILFALIAQNLRGRDV